MGIKSIIFILHCLQICLSYPIDDRQDNFNHAEPSPKFLNEIPELIPVVGSEYANHQGIPEIVSYANQFAFDYPDDTPTINTNHFGDGNRPFVRPPRPRPPPDDVEVFAPPEQPRPPRPYPPSRPIPQGPNYGPFWPTNGRPVTFPKDGVLREGHIEMVPVLVEKDQINLIPERIESNMQIIPESTRNGEPMMGKKDLPMSSIMAESPNPVVLIEERERPQIMPEIIENEPVRMTPALVERLARPVIIEDERPKMMQLMETEQPMPQPMIIENEKSFEQPPKSPLMTHLNENEGTMTVERESPREPMLMIMEKGDPFMKPVQRLQEMPFSQNEAFRFDEKKDETLFSENQGFMGDERRDPSEFIHIPQRLPERFKRNDHNDLEATKSFSNFLEDKLLIDRQSIVDNEIMMKDENLSNSENPEKYKITMGDENITPTSTTSTSLDHDSKDDMIKNEIPINVENIPIANSESPNNEPNHEISAITSILDSKKLDFDHDAKEPLSKDDSSTTTVQPPNNEVDEKITPPTSISSDVKVEHENENQTALNEKIINNENNQDKTESSSHPVEIPTTLSPNNAFQQTTTVPIDSMEPAKILELVEDFENKIETNQAASNHISENSPAINATEDFTHHSNEHKQESPITDDKHPIESPSINQPSVHNDATITPPASNTQIHISHQPCSPIESVEQQMPLLHELPPNEIFSNVPYFYPTHQSYNNYYGLDQMIKPLPDFINAPYGSQGLYNFHQLQGLTQLYPINTPYYQYPFPIHHHVRLIFTD